MRPSDTCDLELKRDGAQHFEAVAVDLLPEICAALSGLPSNRAGVRIQGIEALSGLLDAGGAAGSIAAGFMGVGCRAVRAILFDKTADTNWSLGWHQDRTICVKRRIDVRGYGPWTTKGAMQHVAPPFEILARMITLRIHIDDVPAGNAPLMIAPGSHLRGHVSVKDYDEVVAVRGAHACLAKAGDIWAYATPILHASKASELAARRRVLQVDYSADQLHGGLEWLGI